MKENKFMTDKFNFDKIRQVLIAKKGENLIETPDDDCFYSHPAVKFHDMKNGEGRYITFKCRYGFDLHLGLFKEETPEDGTVKLDDGGSFGICFGGWDNTKVALY
jgi:hypothetical protein